MSELRAIDVLSQLEPREAVGHGLVARLGARGFERARVAVSARVFHRLGVPDPWHPASPMAGPSGLDGAADTGARRQPAPHVQVPEPKRPSPPKAPPPPSAGPRPVETPRPAPTPAPAARPLEAAPPPTPEAPLAPVDASIGRAQPRGPRFSMRPTRTSGPVITEVERPPDPAEVRAPEPPPMPVTPPPAARAPAESLDDLFGMGGDEGRLRLRPKKAD